MIKKVFIRFSQIHRSSAPGFFIAFLAITSILVSSCEPEWKTTVNLYGEKLAALEKLNEEVKSADKDAIESAKTIIHEMEALEQKLSNIDDDEAKEELAKLAEEYVNAVELTVNITKYEDMVNALEESLVLFEQMERELPDILTLVKGAMSGDILSMQALQKKMPELQEMALKLQNISSRMHPDDAVKFQEKLKSLKEKYPELEQLGM